MGLFCSNFSLPRSVRVALPLRELASCQSWLTPVGEHDSIGGDGKENQHRDESVGGEEGGVEFAEVIGLYQGVLVKERQPGDGYAEDRKVAEAEAEEHPSEKREGNDVEDAGEAERTGDPEGARTE